MISKNLEKIKRLARKDFILNFFSLTIFQAIELLIPLITIPIIISKVGAEKFGLISFAIVFSFLFQLFVDFGFNTISTRDISLNKKDFKKVSQIFNETLNSKIILSLICCCFFLSIILFFDKFNSDIEIYIYTFISFILQSLIPFWFFQGLQKSKYITISSFIGRFIYLLLILLFLKSEKNYLLVPIFNAIGFLISFIITFTIINKKFKIKFTTICLEEFKNQLKKGRFMFLSELKLYFISYFNVLLLGFIFGNIAVAYFVGAEKIIKAISNMFTPIQNSLLPILAINLNQNKKATFRLINKTLPVALFVLCVFSFFLFHFSENIIVFILGAEMRNSIIVFKILSFVPLFTFLDSFLGKQILLNLKKEKQIFKVILIVALVNIPIILYFINNYSYIGAAIAQLTALFSVVVGFFYYYYKILKEK